MFDQYDFSLIRLQLDRKVLPGRDDSAPNPVAPAMSAMAYVVSVRLFRFRNRCGRQWRSMGGSMARHNPIRLFALALAAGAGLSAAPAAAEDVASFYKGANINVIVGFGAGGGYDLYARTMARHIGRHIPGNPNLVVQNMTGAGSMRAANHVYSVAPKDGTVIAAVNQNMPIYQVLGGEGATYDALKLYFLGSMASSNGVTYVWHTSPTKTLEDARNRETTLGGTSNRADSYIFPTAINELAGTRFRVVTGYTGTTQIHLAMERGEVEGRGGSTWASLQSGASDWLRDNKINLLIQIGFEKESDLPDIPLLRDLVKPEERPAVDIINLPTAIGYAHWISPDVPTDRAEALRKAYADMLKDAEFLEEAAKLNMMIRPKTGEEMEKLVRSVAAAPAPVLERTARLLGWAK